MLIFAFCIYTQYFTVGILGNFRRQGNVDTSCIQKEEKCNIFTNAFRTFQKFYAYIKIRLKIKVM